MSKLFSGAVFGTYALAGRLATPLLALYLRRRLKRGKEDPNRLSERWGREKTTRPSGALVWIHAASLGESLAVLPMIGRIKDERPDLTLLMTSGTVTAAKLLGERLPPGVLHRYVPIDAPQAVGRFLNHWKPNLGLLVESELWPNLLRLAHRRGLPLALINARMSSRSHQRWRRLRPLALDLLGRLTLVLAESEESAARFRDLGARQVASLGNLKTAAAPLVADEGQLENLSSALGTRARWLAASTHEGEETLALAAHQMIAQRFPDLITLIVPRHPERGTEVALLAGRQGLAAQQRSLGLLPSADDRIYIGDTLGELGLFYRVSPIAFVGGSLVPKGGQNPLEPARLGAALLYGPHSDNFKLQTEQLEAAGALTRVTSAKELAAAVEVLLGDPALRRKQGAAAEAASASEEKVLADCLAALRPLLPR